MQNLQDKILVNVKGGSRTDASLPPPPELKERPPIVVVMGHVDHGKTTLLDAIRKTNVAGKESGGITQGIGAYEITLTNADYTQTSADHAQTNAEKVSVSPRAVSAGPRKITFIDTPGHEAFFAMRAHGAKLADVALLVVAADDGVRPQTEEAIKHIAEAKIPFIAVINKTDKPGAVIDRVKKELSDRNVLIEEWGGKVPLVAVSAKTGEGINELLDLILLVAEMEELKYDPASRGEGYVVEANLDGRRGITATIVITNGCFMECDLLACGSAFGPIKIMEDDHGQTLEEAWPSKPVRIVGLSELPLVGEKCGVVAKGQDVSAIIAAHEKEHQAFLDSLKIEPAGQAKTLPLVVKAAAQGSLAAVLGVLKQIKSDRVGLKLLKHEVGDITQSDIKQAETTGARVVGFRVGVNKEAAGYADQRGVVVKTFDVIYEFVEAVKKMMAELLDPEIVKTEVGRLEILAVFKAGRPRMVVGGKIFSGKLKQGLKVEILRGEASLGTGKIVELQRNKEPQTEVSAGNEAGILLESDVAAAVGDVLAGFEEERRYPEL
ncbi:MAG: translation initiation factor IF-2 [Patescibacteria group bacterium]